MSGENSRFTSDRRPPSRSSWADESDWVAGTAEDVDVVGGELVGRTSKPDSALSDTVDNHWPLVAGKGTVQQDAVGAIDATMSGSRWKSDSDAVGGYLVNYDGTASDSLGSSLGYIYTGDMTITAYVLLDDASLNVTIYGDQAGYNETGFRFRVRNGSLGFISEGRDSCSHSDVLSDGTVYFVSARWNTLAGEVTLGVNENYETFSHLPPAEPSGDHARWGQPGARNDFYFSGGMDERTISGSYLSNSDLAILRARRSDF